MESFYSRKKGQRALKSYFVSYGVRSPPKFMVEILGSSFKFSTSTINFTAEFKIVEVENLKDEPKISTMNFGGDRMP